MDSMNWRNQAMLRRGQIVDSRGVANSPRVGHGRTRNSHNGAGPVTAQSRPTFEATAWAMVFDERGADQEPAELPLGSCGLRLCPRCSI